MTIELTPEPAVAPADRATASRTAHRSATSRPAAADGAATQGHAPVAIARERRLANLRATLQRPGGPPAGPLEPPARAPHGGRRGAALAARLADALGAEVRSDARGSIVRRVPAPVALPVDRARLATLPGQPPPDAPLVCLDTETTGLATAAGTLAFLVGLGRWDGETFHQVQLLLPDHADEPALLAELESWIGPECWLVTYNGRGFDWPLVEARYRLAGRQAPAVAGHLDLLPFVRRVFRHRMADARLRTVEGDLLGIERSGDVGGWEIPGIYLDVLRGGPIEPLAAVVRHNELDVRSLGLLLAHVEQRYGSSASRAGAPRGDLAGLARAYGRARRDDEALVCLDDALASPGSTRDPFGRTRIQDSPLDRRGSAGSPGANRPTDDLDWWSPRIRPDFGGRPPRAGWRGPLAAGRGGPLGPAPSTAAWDAGGRWTDERLAAERARVLRRLARWADAVDAWQTAAAAGGALGVIAWIEVAKIREHRLGDPSGAQDATRMARLAAEGSRLRGRPLLRLEADLARRARRLARRAAAGRGR